MVSFWKYSAVAHKNNRLLHTHHTILISWFFMVALYGKHCLISYGRTIRTYIWSGDCATIGK